MMAEDNRDEIELSPMLESLAAQYAADPKSKKFLPLAEEYRKSRMYEEALYILTEGLKLHPDFLPARLTLAKCYMETRERDNALHVLGTILDEHPDNVPALRLISELHRDLGNYSRAAEHAKQLLAISPADQVAQNLLQEIAPHLGSEVSLMAGQYRDDEDNRKSDGTWQHHESAVSLELDDEMRVSVPEQEGLDLDEESEAPSLSLTIPASEKDEVAPRIIELSQFDGDAPTFVSTPSAVGESSEPEDVRVTTEQHFDLEESSTPVFELDAAGDEGAETSESISAGEASGGGFHIEPGDLGDLEDEDVIEVDLDAPLFAVEEEETPGDEAFDMFHKLSESRGPLSLELPEGEETSGGVWKEEAKEDDDSGLSTIRRDTLPRFENPFAGVGETEATVPGSVKVDEEPLTVSAVPADDGDDETTFETVIEPDGAAEEEDLILSADSIVDTGSLDSEEDLVLTTEDMVEPESGAILDVPALEVVELHTMEGSDLLNIEDEELELGEDAIVARAGEPLAEVPSEPETVAAAIFETVSLEEVATATEIDDRDYLLDEPAAELDLPATAEFISADIETAEEAEELSLEAAPTEEAPFVAGQYGAEVYQVETPAPQHTQDGEDAVPITATSARIYEEQGLYRDALDIYRKLAARFPEMPDYLDKIAEIEGRLIAAEGPVPAWDQERTVQILKRWLRNIDAFKASR